jgi:hypothetical protein
MTSTLYPHLGEGVENTITALVIVLAVAIESCSDPVKMREYAVAHLQKLFADFDKWDSGKVLTHSELAEFYSICDKVDLNAMLDEAAS